MKVYGPSIKRNFVFRIFYEILVVITPLITAPYISRVLGADGVGIYSYTNSILTYFTMFAALGTAEYGAREIARNRDNRNNTSRLFWEIELVTVFTTSICLLLWICLILFDKSYSPYFIALTPALIAVAADISWLYVGYENISFTVVINAISKIVGVFLIFLFVKKKSDLALYIFLMSLITLVGNISMWIFLAEFVDKVEISSIHIFHHLKETFIYFIPTIATSIYTVLDKTLIGVITQDSFQNGYYEQANKIISIAKTLSFTALNGVMGARLSFLFGHNQFQEARNKINQAMNIILLLSFGCCFGICAIAKDFVPVFFGTGYEPVIQLLYLMAPLVVIIGISNFIGALYLTPVGRIKEAGILIAVGSGANLVFNLLMIPRWGAIGATIGTIIAESIITILFLIAGREYAPFTEILKCSVKKAISGILMLIIISGLRNIIDLPGLIKVLIEILAGIISYAAVLWILRDNTLKDLLKYSKSFITSKLHY